MYNSYAIAYSDVTNLLEQNFSRHHTNGKVIFFKVWLMQSFRIHLMISLENWKRMKRPEKRMEGKDLICQS